VQPFEDEASNSSARLRVAGGLRLRLRVGMDREPIMTRPPIEAAKRKAPEGDGARGFKSGPLAGASGPVLDGRFAKISKRRSRSRQSGSSDRF
jgi:hypothetical protein